IFAAEKGLKLPLRSMGEIAGDFDPIEEIELPEGDLLALAIDEEGETGEEAEDAQLPGAAVRVRPRAIPLPSITPAADSGSSPQRDSRRQED
ncbi:MAG: hypothetical protein MK312_15770, partial [Roseibacillus sp.]|nr:hypothetical protein [Roseibacillus sp.]